MALTLGSIARKHFAMGLFVNFFHKKGQKNKKGVPVARTPTPISAAASTEARSRLGFASPRTDTVPTTSPALIGVVLLSMRNQICSQNYKIEIRREK